MRLDPAHRKARFAAWLRDRFFLRFHMGVILASTFVAGLAVTKAFLIAGNTNLAVRYGVAVAASYGAFLLLMQLWIWYVAHDDDHDTDVLDVADGVDLVDSAIRFGADGADVPAAFQGAGGSFGGGGASGSFGEAASDGVAAVGDGDEGGCAVAVVLALAAVVLTVLVAALYLVYAAPAILAEAAFQALLAPALLPAARRAEAEGWATGAVRATAVPFVCMLIAAIGFGWAANDLCPDARRMADVVACAQR